MSEAGHTAEMHPHVATSECVQCLTTRLAEVMRHANEDREAWFEKCAKLSARLAEVERERDAARESSHDFWKLQAKLREEQLTQAREALGAIAAFRYRSYTGGGGDGIDVPTDEARVAISALKAMQKGGEAEPGPISRELSVEEALETMQRAGVVGPAFDIIKARLGELEGALERLRVARDALDEGAMRPAPLGEWEDMHNEFMDAANAAIAALTSHQSPEGEA